MVHYDVVEETLFDTREAFLEEKLLGEAKGALLESLNQLRRGRKIGLGGCSAPSNSSAGLNFTKPVGSRLIDFTPFTVTFVISTASYG